MNVEHLDVSSNRIEVLENIPEKVKELMASCNVVKEINVSNGLQYLDVSYNQLGDDQIERIRRGMKELRHLNLSYNNICEIEKVFLLGEMA